MLADATLMPKEYIISNKQNYTIYKYCIYIGLYVLLYTILLNQLNEILLDDLTPELHYATKTNG